MRSFRTFLLGALLVGLATAASAAPCATAVGPSPLEDWSITRSEPTSVFAELAARPVDAIATPRPVRRGHAPATASTPAEPAFAAVAPPSATVAFERSRSPRPSVAALTCVLRV